VNYRRAVKSTARRIDGAAQLPESHVATRSESGSSRRDEIVREALTLLNDSGLEAVTLREVARRLEVRLNTVSWHVKTKAGLQELMAEAILSEVDLGELPTAPRERITALAQRYRRAMLAYRDGARVVAGTMVTEPATLALAEQMVATLLEGGLPEEAAAATCWTIVYFALGLTQEEQDTPPDLSEHAARIREDSRYPALHRVLPSMLGHAFDQRFEFGLSLILDGAEGHVTQAPL
jgi:TetR/AcrR family tetracycline transcriptional repressor